MANSNPKTNGNDPVGTFPTEMHPGLTKREYFAAMAMQGILSGAQIERTGRRQSDQIAEYAIRLADALIEELNK